MELYAGSGNAVLTGEGLRHAFLSSEEKTTLTYLISFPHLPQEEFEINPMDPEFGIDWGVDVAIIFRK